ncbi:hypothetical protein OAG71_05135, partial [bacterium]|nr:hypothetical protein [bacterium]
VQKGSCPWWRPERPRRPSDLLRPKLIGPHLMLYPKFSFDSRGNRAVSRTIFITHSEDDFDALHFALAVMNSSIGHWQISTQSHKYSRGYARIEAATLRKFHVPSPATVPHMLLSSIVDKTKSLIEKYDSELDDKLDKLVSEAFGIEHSWIPNAGNEEDV